MGDLTTRRKGDRSRSQSRTRDIIAGLRESLAGRRKSGPAGPAGDFFGRNWPSLEVSENENEVAVKVEVPGLSEKDLELSYLDGSLLIKGEKREEKEENNRDVYYRESRYGSFTRSVPVGTDVDFNKAKAEYRQGVLRVNLPKIAGGSRQTKRIEIT
ncbi:MAG: hypothetical protein JWP91_2683 [Fibrobacteres bacterium]|nr:hypothetical protein [Fibrobacterota bacterium]